MSKHLMQRFLNGCLLINSRVDFTYANKRSVLINWKMSNANKNITTSFVSAGIKIHVLGSGAVGVPANVVLDIGSKRCLINCGEGTQKLGIEYKFGFQRISQIFITSPTWENLGGLLGVILEREARKIECFIHGHSGIENIFMGTANFIKKKIAIPNLRNCHHYEEVSNMYFSVKYVLLYSKNIKNLSGSLLDTSDEGESSVSKNTEDSFSTSEKEISHLPKNVKSKTKRSGTYYDENSVKKFTETPKINHNYVISYIFRTSKIAGKLLLEKCVEYGVPPGPLLGLLKNGQDVTLSNGIVVRSSDVKEPDLPGLIIIVLECPTEDYLDSLLNEPIYSKYQSGEDTAAVVIHFSSSQVVKNPKYQAWIKHFDKKTKHLFINKDNKLTGSVSIRRQQFKLNYLHPTIFPLLQNDIPDFPRAMNCEAEKGHDIISIPKENTGMEPVYLDKVFYKCARNSFISGETHCTVNLKAKYDYDYSKSLVLKKGKFLQEMFKIDNQGEIEKCKEKLKYIERSLEADKRIYPKIVFLGTGSGKPSKTRNSSGILIFLEENKSMILDCGENIFNQLINFYGEKKTKEILRNLMAIYISHPHVDHHMGVITLLKERKLAFDNQNELLVKDSSMQAQEQIIQPVFQPVFLLAPTQVLSWLNLFSEKIENILDLYVMIPTFNLVNKNKDVNNKKEVLQKSLNLTDILTAPVCHVQGSYGISIVHEKGWKITYSGDTRPCNDLVKIGMDSDILIHEATFDDGYTLEAKLKNHSVTGEAIEIGKKMRAKYILLTHFSQRYCYLPVIEKNMESLNIGVAFDFMEVPFNKLPLLSALLEPIQCIFSEYSMRTVKGNALLKRKQDEEGVSSKESSMKKKNKSARVLLK